MKNPKIGLICKSHNYAHQESYEGSGVVTGDWVISPKRISTLVGQDVILTESSTSPAYLGGEITGYNRLSNGKYVLFFSEDTSYRGFNGHIPAWTPSTNPVRYL